MRRKFTVAIMLVFATGAGLVVAAAFFAGWASGIPQYVLAQAAKSSNPVAQLLAQRFAPEPNLLVEDHVEISCEPNFSVKVFTAVTLHNASFVVRDASTGAVLFGPEVVARIDPLWEKVWLGPLSSIPSKIFVELTAITSDGKTVFHQLIVEPDCEEGDDGHSVVNHVIVLWPIGKILVNPLPPLDPGDPESPRRMPIPDLTVAVPRDAVGENATIIVRNHAGSVICQPGPEPIPTEIVALSLVSCNPIPLSPESSFFDIFYEIQIPDLPPFNHSVRLIDASLLESLGAGGGHNIISTL